MEGDRTETRAPARVARERALGPALFVVLQCRRLRDTPARITLDSTREVEIGRGTTLAAYIKGDVLRVDIPDTQMSSVHARIRPALGMFTLEDAGSKNGTFVAGAAQQRLVLGDGDWIEMGSALLR